MVWDYNIFSFIVDVNDCMDHLCNYGATCVDGVDQYTCSCVDGYTGIYCETGNIQISFSEYLCYTKFLQHIISFPHPV